MAVAWYYKLYWKMEGWLASKAHKSLDPNRGFFSRMLSDGKGRLRESPLPARAETKSFTHFKPLPEKINSQRFF